MKWKKDFLNFFVFIFKTIMYPETLIMLPSKILKMTHNDVERRCDSLKDSDDVPTIPYQGYNIKGFEYEQGVIATCHWSWCNPWMQCTGYGSYI